MNFSLKFLIVDDSETVRESTRQALMSLGFTHMTEAHDGVEAMCKIHEAQENNKQFDLILVDWLMPQMKGIEVIKACKADAKLKHLHFMIITSEQESVNVLEGLRSGAVDFITKPFTAETLAIKIERALVKMKIAS